ncbi:glycoside hydrolase family 3 N-terminal domain-containing protein [Glutamicibacter sp. PS]|uniref:glycoside hydrolase family 3 protein n=1 Tax=Glutamicibacter sp. PS TaxID=3075634 RepID=UPI002849AFA1|nr:glycoside hydrolase family 3 N-terminal domain-containing protein [Glutamicibacter sp. PS]MDR4533547.1 hypothetical protein [Glutamicibacter sp. PS]
MIQNSSAETLRRLAAGTLMPGFTGTTLPEWVVEEFGRGLAAVCIYGDNISTHAQLRDLTAQIRAAAPEAIVALDEEGGDVTRIHYRDGSNQPGNAILGRLNDLELTRASARAIARELRSLGFNLNLAPDADINSCAENPVIGVRSFGTDPDVVAAHTAAYTVGLQGEGVAACAKHFPGHGDTNADSHLTLPVVSAEQSLLAQRELVPFVKAIATDVAAIMTSHILVPDVDAQNPATFSRSILHELLRGDLGFRGVIISDALDMAGASAHTGIPTAAVRALQAGADLLCLGTGTTAESFDAIARAIIEAVSSGALSESRLREATQRTAQLASRYRPREVSARGETLPSGQWSRAFELGCRVEEWISDPAPVQLVQVDSTSNPAVGHVPWGLASVAPTVGLENIVTGSKILLAARGLHAKHPARATVETLRAAGHRVLLVNFGWPTDGADVTTFGASPAVARCVLNLLTP